MFIRFLLLLCVHVAGRLPGSTYALFFLQPRACVVLACARFSARVGVRGMTEQGRRREEA